MPPESRQPRERARRRNFRNQILAIIQKDFYPPFRSAPLAQLDRASGYEPEGREFESLRAHHPFLISKLPLNRIS